MNRLAIIGVFCLRVAAALGSVTASLEVAPRQDEALRPYATAALTLTNDGDAGVEAVALRPTGGGPAVRYAFSVPPGQTARRDVALPAMWPIQQYRVEALDAAGLRAGVADAEITWPGELVATGAFINDAYAPWRGLRPGWPARTRRNCALLLALFVAAAGGALLVRRKWARPVLVAALAAAATALVVVLGGWPAAAEAEAHVLVRYGEGPASVESFTVLSARRSGRVRLTAAGVPHPVYPDRSAALSDDALVDPVARTVTLSARAGQSRVIRPSERTYRPAPGTAGSVRVGPEGDIAVRAHMDHRRALLMVADRCWPVDSGYGDLELRVHSDAGRQVWSVLSHPDRWGLNRRLARLLAYWRARHQRADGFYLLNFTDAPGEIRLEVLRLEAPATR